MPVVTDAMLLGDLLEIGEEQLLPHRFPQGISPPAVARELDRPRAPAVVRPWMAAPPVWLRLRQPALPHDPGLRRLHAGEQEALLLMMEHAAPLLLTDDGEAY